MEMLSDQLTLPEAWAGVNLQASSERCQVPDFASTAVALAVLQSMEHTCSAVSALGTGKELKQEMHAAAVEASACRAPPPKPKRGARPDRPSQRAREAGRSWERMAEKLSEVKVELAMKSVEAVELQGKMAEMEAEQGQKVKMLTEQISQLEAANFQVTAAHNQLLASLPNLGRSGEYKQLYEQSEGSARLDVSSDLFFTTDNLQQLQVMLDEKQAAAEERRAQLVKEHVRQLKNKEAEFKEQSREVTALRELDEVFLRV
eukprot:s8325_g1.t1